MQYLTNNYTNFFSKYFYFAGIFVATFKFIDIFIGLFKIPRLIGLWVYYTTILKVFIAILLYSYYELIQ